MESDFLYFIVNTGRHCKRACQRLCFAVNKVSVLKILRILKKSFTGSKYLLYPENSKGDKASKKVCFYSIHQELLLLLSDPH